MRPLLIILFACSFNALYAQHECGSDLVHSRRMAHDVEYRDRYMQNQQRVRARVAAHQAENAAGRAIQADYTIPVVVHVIHLGEAVGQGSNISNAQVQDAIDGVNDRFSGDFGQGVDVNIQFCLAQTDPTGCPSTGVVRVNGSSVPSYAAEGITVGDCGADEYEVKDLSYWPVEDYYNIWVVHNICGGEVAGYAYYPNGDQYDGAVMHVDYMSSETHVLAHEIGHGFNLAHTFEGDEDGTICPDDWDCSWDGDQVCDTPPHTRDDCETNSCTSLGNFNNSKYNFMSYCWLEQNMQRFTAGQKDRMQATMEEYPRASLATSSGCASTGLSLNAGQTEICSGGSTVLTVSGPGSTSYTWSTGETTSSITVSPSSTTTYSVTGTTSGGCDVSSSMVISVVPTTSAVMVTTGEVEDCSGELGLSVSPAGQFQSYLWTTGETTPSITVTSSGSFGVEVVDLNGCTNTSLLDNPTVVVIGATPPIVELIGTTLSVTNATYATYQWYYNGSPIDGANGPSHNPTVGGLYLLQVSDGEGCFATTVNIPFSFVGIGDDLGLSLLTLYPNPSHGTFTVGLTGVSGPLELQLYDAVGRVVRSAVLNGASPDIVHQFSGLCSGTYVLDAVTSGERLLWRVVIY